MINVHPFNLPTVNNLMQICSKKCWGWVKGSKDVGWVPAVIRTQTGICIFNWISVGVVGLAPALLCVQQKIINGYRDLMQIKIKWIELNIKKTLLANEKVTQNTRLQTWELPLNFHPFPGSGLRAVGSCWWFIRFGLNTISIEYRLVQVDQ